MAAQMRKGMQPSNSTDALFREWVTFIFNVFVAAGWVQTADTGQANPATVLHPVASNTKAGYLIFRMNDALQATAPVFLRLDVGSAGGGANNPAIWITLGGGTDGAGNISSTATYFGPQQVQSSSNATNQSPCYSFGSGSASRVAFAMFLSPTSASFANVWSIERSKTPSGADDSAALLVFWANNSSNLDRSQVVYLGSRPNPPTEQGLMFVLSQRSPSAASDDVGVSLEIPFAGIAQAPGKTWLVGSSGDWNVDSRIVAQAYSETITYQGLGSQFRTTALGVAPSSWLLMMRYD